LGCDSAAANVTADVTRVIASLLVVVGMTLFTPAQAQAPSTGSGPAFPNKSIRLIAPFPAGGPIDAVARTLAPRLG
jgi:tripartite-type tricarboxylate transporter receptor subunit TctC